MIEEQNVVKQGDLTDLKVPEGVLPKATIQEAQPAEAVETTPAPGSKTDSELLLASLKEEREKRRILEEEKRLLEEKLQTPSNSVIEDDGEDEVVSDEARILSKKIDTLDSKLKSIEEKEILDRVQATYPVLKDKSEELKEFKKDYPGVPMDKVAKLYLAENGYFDKTRVGLEKPTSGDKTIQKVGYTADEVRNLRETNHKKYIQLLKEGKLKIAE